MKYLWTEDTGAGLHFWKLVNQRLMMKRHYISHYCGRYIKWCSVFI